MTDAANPRDRGDSSCRTAAAASSCSRLGAGRSRCTSSPRRRASCASSHARVRGTTMRSSRGARRARATSSTAGPHHDRPDPASRFQPEGVHGPSDGTTRGRFAWQDREWRGPAALVVHPVRAARRDVHRRRHVRRRHPASRLARWSLGSPAWSSCRWRSSPGSATGDTTASIPFAVQEIATAGRRG